jgi:hypothetical protein
MGRTDCPDLKPITSQPWLVWHSLNESEMARSSECTEQYAQEVFDSADIVRDAMFRAKRGTPYGPFPTLTTLVIKTKLTPPTFPLTSQHPVLGKIM